jgi:hypothetical protein
MRMSRSTPAQTANRTAAMLACAAKANDFAMATRLEAPIERAVAQPRVGAAR